MNLRKALLVLVPASLIAFGFYYKSKEAGDDILMQSVVQTLKNYHFSPKDFNDDLSEKVFKEYLGSLDNTKKFLLQTDVDRLKKYEKQLDEEALNGTYFFFEESSEIISERIKKSESFINDLLAKPFNFKIDESVETEYDDLKWAKNEAELKDRWRKYLKYNVMTKLASGLEIQEAAIEKKDTSVKILSYDTLESQARKSVLKTHEDWFKRLGKVTRKDRLSAYINSFTLVFDPHTNYFPPKDKENFDIGISGKLEGIGAQLQERDGYIKVYEIVPGSPSARQGELKAGDIILKVAQGAGEAVSIVDIGINEAVKLIRGAKGTEVRLTVKKADGTIKVIKIIRDVVILEDTFAKSSIITDEDNKKIGYIFLPKFYTDFENGRGRTCWRDVRDEIKKLKKEGVEGIVFDVRNNGGGSLQDVVNMGGLFIPSGPIVQVKSRGERAQTMDDPDNGVEWAGPLVIMTNSFSASASEILAAAMQDYKRAVIMGTKSTFGKGTVQQFIDLNNFFRGNGIPDLGAIKITTSKFYRISGGTTQLRGVEPDIIFPDNYSYLKVGEKEEDYPLAWDQIEKAKFKPDEKSLASLSKIKGESEKRMAQNPVFLSVTNNAKRLKEQSDKKTVTLNLKKFMEEDKIDKAENKKIEDLYKPIVGFQVNHLSADLQSFQSDTAKLNRNNDWIKNLQKDFYLYESFRVCKSLKN